MKNKPQVRKIYSFVVDGECEITYTDLGKELKKYLSDYQKAEAEYVEFNKTQKIISDFDKEIKRLKKQNK